jgi:hypothetical protein
MMRPIPSYGTLMTIEEFYGYVDSGMFIDYDGHGSWATSTHIISDDYVKPSTCKGRKVDKSGLMKSVAPPEATHVVWYNK